MISRFRGLLALEALVVLCMNTSSTVLDWSSLCLFFVSFFLIVLTDHCVHYYDLRNTTLPITVFKGHRKAVSYTKFINTEEIVSA